MARGQAVRPSFRPMGASGLFVLGFFLAACVGQIDADDASGRPGGGGASADPLCEAHPARIWRLSPEQYESTVLSLLPEAGPLADEIRATLPPRGTAFSNPSGQQTMSSPHVAQLFELTRRLGALAVAAADRFVPCASDGSRPSGDCASSFVQAFAERAYRRALTAEETMRLEEMRSREAARWGETTALELVVRSILLSPSFLFRTELGPFEAGDAPIALTPEEKASSLAYFLLDAPPDASLLAAARRGDLETPVGVEAETRRLLSDPGATRGVLRYFLEHLKLQTVRQIRKSAETFPEWSNELSRDLALETEHFLRDVLANDPRIETLLTASYSMLNARLAEHYGVPVESEAFSRVELPPDQRSGVLTQGAFLARFARENDTDPVARGVFLRENILCGHVPAPPPEVNAVPIPPDGAHTQRERLEPHSSDVTCRGCHSLIDPLGLPFETYDGIGRFRTTDVGKPIDTRGAVTGTQESDATVADALELTRHLGRSLEVRTCFARKLFQFAYGDDHLPQPCQTRAVLERFDPAKGNLHDLVVAITTDPRFFERKVKR